MSPLQTSKCTLLCVLIESRNEIAVKKAVKNEAKKPKVTPKVKKAISKAPAQKAKKDAAPAQVRYISVITSERKHRKRKRSKRRKMMTKKATRTTICPARSKPRLRRYEKKDVFTC